MNVVTSWSPSTYALDDIIREMKESKFLLGFWFQLVAGCDNIFLNVEDMEKYLECMLGKNLIL